MYNKDKRELLTKIADGLNHAKVRDPQANNGWFSPEHGTLQCLGFLPKENLQKILDIGFDDVIYDSLYQRWGREGVFKIQPYVFYDAMEPVLVLRHNRYLCLTDTGYFAMFADPAREVICAKGTFDMSFLINISKGDRVLSRGVLAYLLWWAALIEVVSRYDVSRLVLKANTKLVEEFLHAVIYNRTLNTYGYDCSCLERNVYIQVGGIDLSSRVVKHVMCNGDILAYLAVGTHSIQVEQARGVLVTVNVPNTSVGTCLSYAGADADELKEATQIYERNNYLGILSMLALNVAGLCVSEAGVCWFDKHSRSTMKSVVPTINKASDIKHLIPDSL